MSKITSDFRKSALRRGILIRPNSNHNTPQALLNATSIELANLGFIVDPKNLKGMSLTNLDETISEARSITGADRDMTPVYPGFPKQVEELSTSTLLIEQILHYMSAGTLIPNYPTIAREGLAIEDMLRGARELEVLTASKAAQEIISELVTSSIAISVDDKTLLKGALDLHKISLDEVKEIGSKAYNGENMQTFVTILLEHNTFSREDLALSLVKTCSNIDQLLRLVLALYAVPVNNVKEKDFNLAVHHLNDRSYRSFKMLTIPRNVRRAIVGELDRLTRDFKADRLVNRMNLWRRVMKSIHPYDFKLDKSQKRALDIIHSNIEYKTLNSLIESNLENGNIVKVVNLFAENNPSALLSRIVEILRKSSDENQIQELVKALDEHSYKASLTTLISAYNGVISANDDATRVNRVAGMNNTMLSREGLPKINEDFIKTISKTLKNAMVKNLKDKNAPSGKVNISSTVAVPLVRRDAATSDRLLDRGSELTPIGAGDTLRIFGHWNNNQNRSGYMDIGAVVLDEKFNKVAVCTWDTYSNGDNREWSTYSGDNLVYPGNSAAEYVDVKLSKLKKAHPEAKWIAMTVQSWSGFPTCNVDFIAGAMYRSDAYKGEVFDARSVETAFKPTTESTQSVPLAVNVESGQMFWIDSSNGSNSTCVSSSADNTIGAIVYDEIMRPRLTMGELAKLWAKAHGAKTLNKPVNRDEIIALVK